MAHNFYDIAGVKAQRVALCHDCPHLPVPYKQAERQAKDRAAAAAHRCHNAIGSLCAGPMRAGQDLLTLARQIDTEMAEGRAR